MSTQLLPEQVCYVHCNFCNTILAVNVPSQNTLNVVTVRCGHCTNLLSVNVGGQLQANYLQDHQKVQYNSTKSQDLLHGHSGSTSDYCRTSPVSPMEDGPQRMLPIRPPEKRQRVPSAYNRFIKEEIQRIKASNPNITHREAFSTAAKNWAHFPHIHFGLNSDSNKQGKCDELLSQLRGQKI